ncbi:TlpA family protein disulfide reductase [Portibacter marinus]|uniref:TlpA family protein disulfide reductase n=1 Tax=Portibacter marinus TaxID=2898660 RepID=UPI001F1F3C9A|nr:TlpA disulfide reductase family protein [Portibacter marinus]
MKTLLIKILTILFFSYNVNSQNASKWYKTYPLIDIEGSWCIYSSKNVDSTLNSRYQLQFDYIQNFQLSSFNSLSKNDSINFPIKDAILGARGNLNGNPILIIDSDLDRSLTDEMIIMLPKLEKDPSIEYSEIYNYSTAFNQNFEITYEKVVDNLIHLKTSNIGFTVNHKYNESTDKLEYVDNFKICFNQKLKFDGSIEGSRVQISCYDYLPWITIVRFHIRTKDFPYQKIDIKTPFRIREDGPLYIIDSVDFINNKFLISNYGQTEKFYYSGESLYSDQIVDTDSITDNYKLIHVWGSWCGPCIRNLPKLIELQKEFTNIEFIGICEERNKEAGMKAASKAGMTWKNIFSPISQSKLNVLSYPTYFLIEKNEVVVRFKNLDEAEKYFRKL